MLQIQILIACGGSGDLSSCEINVGASQESSWTEIASLPAGVRSLRGLSVNNRVFMIAGAAGGSLTNNIFELNTTTTIWQTVGNLKFGREWHGVTALTGKEDMKKYCLNT